MGTPLLMLGLLAFPWCLARLTGRSDPTQRHAAAFGITLVFCFTGIGHFAATQPMAAMIPAWVPGRAAIVYVTGILEILTALLVLIPSWRRPIGWLLLAMLVLFLPVNVYGAIQRIPFGGHEWGPVYLLIRVPLQLVLMAWVYWFTVRPSPSAAA